MEASLKKRNQTYFIKMRNFHNYVKRYLYNKYTYNINNLLELAVGKAGDLPKWNRNNIKNVIGYDIDKDSIQEGKKRIKNNINHGKYTLKVKDLSKDIIGESTTKYDVISAQFSFHYFFKTKETFETIIVSIKNNIKNGGYFIGSIFDGDSVKKLIGDKNSISFNKNGVKLFSLKKEDNSNAFGNKLEVYLHGTVLDKPTIEYLVDFKFLKKLFEDNGFELVETKMFSEFYKDSFDMNLISKKISFLNRIFVFRKK
jgi:mRNA (guanine-N7-)-methyltransferase